MVAVGESEFFLTDVGTSQVEVQTVNFLQRFWQHSVYTLVAFLFLVGFNCAETFGIYVTNTEGNVAIFCRHFTIIFLSQNLLT